MMDMMSSVEKTKKKKVSQRFFPPEKIARAIKHSISVQISQYFFEVR
jgi:hypothetical protein